MNFFIGTILPWAGMYAPQGWTFCEGQLLSIKQNTDLYSVIGTQYGGDGITTFALPDLRGRFPIGAGYNEATGTTWQTGQKFDSTMKAVIETSNLPAHNHKITSTAQSSSGTTILPLSLDIEIPVNTDTNPNPANVNTPKDNTLAVGKTSGPMQANIYTGNGPTANATLKPFTVEKDIIVPEQNVKVTSTCNNTGSGTPVNVAPSHLCIKYIIAIEGIIPTKG